MCKVWLAITMIKIKYLMHLKMTGDKITILCDTTNAYDIPKLIYNLGHTSTSHGSTIIWIFFLIAHVRR